MTIPVPEFSEKQLERFALALFLFPEKFSAIFDFDGTIRCASCGGTRNVNVATCLETGWPWCCGHMMRLQERLERLRS